MKKLIYIMAIQLVCMLASIVILAVANADPEIIGGKESNPRDWLEVVKLSPVGCTATIVGPRSLLTAAHCAESKKQSFLFNNQTYFVSLTQHPKYGGGNMNFDIAMGVIDKDIDIPFAEIADVIETGMKVKVVGYGANTRSNTGYGILREGESSINGIGVGDFTMTVGHMIYYGDSGGPSFDLEALPKKTVVGVHSRTQSGLKSYDTRVDWIYNREWLMKWAGDNERPVCGLNVCCL